MTSLPRNISSTGLAETRMSPAREPTFTVEEIANPGRFITTGLFSYTEDVWGALEEGIMEAYHASRPMED